MIRTLPLLALFTLLSFTDPSVHAEEDSHPTVRGKIASVDAGRGTLTLEGRKKEGSEVTPSQTFAVDAAARDAVAKLAKGATVTLRLSADRQTVVGVQPPRQRGGGEDGRKSPRPRRTGGTLSEVTADSLVLAQSGDGGERSTTFRIDAITKAFAETGEFEVVGKAENGEDRKRPVRKAIKLGEIAKGTRIVVEHVADVARTVVVPHQKPRKSGEDG